MDGPSPEATTTEHSPRPSPRPLLIGVAGTVAWVVVFGIYAASVFPRLIVMEPYQFGDFLAGIVTPLAFLWIIVGYMQQADALRIQAHELRLQVQELTHQVEATRSLAASAADHADRAMAEAQPTFEHTRTGTSDRDLTLALKNRGARVTHVTSGQTRGGFSISPFSVAVWDRGDEKALNLSKRSEGWIELQYLDGHLKHRSVWFHFDGVQTLTPLPPGRTPEEIEAGIERKREAR